VNPRSIIYAANIILIAQQKDHTKLARLKASITSNSTRNHREH